LVEQVLNQLGALVIGLVLGFYFERRAGRETREQNKELRAELESLRSSVYTVGGSDKPKERDLSLSPDRLVSEVVAYAKAIQDAEGCVRKSLLLEHFTSNGYLPGSVNQALDLAQESGALSIDEMWVTIR
jgi:CHASE2 domain-containing sensor protein